MTLQPNNSFVKFFDSKVLKKERELLDSWDYEICNQYGMDCLFVSQKAKFPKVRHNPIQNDLFFHAYGEISRPEYNEPFHTRVYIQFTEDLFAINGFGLNADLNTTLIFNKTSFALDGALAMADNVTINKQFEFKTEVDPLNDFAVIHYKSNKLNFRTKFNWKKSVYQEKLVIGDLLDFDINPENEVKPDILNTFKRRYSANHYVEKAILYFKCKKSNINRLTGNLRISGTCFANFVVKNPWKAYSKYLNQITPSVGDLVLINGIDDNVIKLELTEVESENKTAQGISPLLGSYSFKCTAKLYIADNNASVLHNPIIAPTDINAKKLIIQTVMNHDASKIANNVSVYEKLYTAADGIDFNEDDIYGGYELESPIGLSNPPNVPIKHDDIIDSNIRKFKWTKYKDKNVQITVKQTNQTISYTPDDLYSYLKNLFDSNYTDYLIQKWEIPELSAVNYSMFDSDLSSENWNWRIALNVPLWYNGNDPIDEYEKKIGDKTIELSSITSYVEPDRRLRQIIDDNELFNEFITVNKNFIDYTNIAAYNGNTDKYEIPLMQHDLSSTYIDVIKDKKDIFSVDILSSDVYELSSHWVEVYPPEKNSEGYEISSRIESFYVVAPEHYSLRTDLYDIEKYNLGSEKFEDLVETTSPNYKKWCEMNIKKFTGPLITIYQFEDMDKSRLATNGKVLFYETTHNGKIYRTELNTLEEAIDISKNETTKYNGETIPMSDKLNWIEADTNGIYFNNAYGNRICLYGKKDIEFDSMSHLNYENDISSPQNSFILTFKNSKYHLFVQPIESGEFTLNLGH